MPFLIEYTIELVLTILLVILLGNAVVIVFTISRRYWRERHFQQTDELRRRCTPVINAILAQEIQYDRGLAFVKDISGTDRHSVLETLCVEKRPGPAEFPILLRLCEDLGLVELWRRHLTGRFNTRPTPELRSGQQAFMPRVGRRSLLLRAKAAENLGIVRHQPSWLLLTRAIDDPDVDVQTAALRALVAIREPASFLELVKRLHAVILDPTTKLSLRSVKAVLAAFPLEMSVQLMASLEHPKRRIRFAATDVIREMVERRAATQEDFVWEPKMVAPELAELLTTRLCFDENPDVRGRAALILACLADPRAASALLTLLDDPDRFVRLQAVRSLAKYKFHAQAAQISRRLTDAHWMVREAAVRTLLVFGQAGIDRLFEHFLDTQDRYSREQIADEMQRAGLIPALLAQYASTPNGRAERVIGLLSQMGKTSNMVAVLRSSSDRSLLKKFLQSLGGQDDPEIRAWVNYMAIQASDAELRGLAQRAIRPAEPRGRS